LQDQDDHEIPAPRQLAERRARLDTPAKVRRELCLLYHEARHGRLDVLDASRMANILALVGRLLEGAELEERLAALEQRVNHKGSTRR
jgi:hypothetical protein